MIAAASGRLASLFHAHLFTQGRMHALPRAVIAPAAKITPDGREGVDTRAVRHAIGLKSRSRYKIALTTARISVLRVALLAWRVGSAVPGSPTLAR